MIYRNAWPLFIGSCSFPLRLAANRDNQINNSSLSLCLQSYGQSVQDSLRLERVRFNEELKRGVNGTDVDIKAPHGTFGTFLWEGEVINILKATCGQLVRNRDPSPPCSTEACVSTGSSSTLMHMTVLQH